MRADPERIYAAQRSGLLRRLVDAERVDEIEAERLLSRWMGEPEDLGRSRGSVGCWDEAWRWIEGERAAERKPMAKSPTLE